MAAAPVGGPAFAPKDAYSRVELSISCSNLKDLDHFSKSDPAVFLYEKKGHSWEKLDRTEVIDNNLNPKFSKTFLVEYRFEEIQQYRFVVYDVDDRRHVDDVRKHDLIGSMECTLADLVTAGQQYSRTLRHQGTPRGQINVLAEEVQDSKFTVTMQLAASKLDKKDFFGKSDPFFEIHKAQEGAGFTVVYRSEPILKTLDPKWPHFTISIRQLCSGDWDRTLKIMVWDWNKSGDHDYIGSCTTTLRDVCPERGGEVFNLDIINADTKKKKKKYRNSGVLNFVSVKVVPEHSFMDYVKGGCEIGLMVAVDFTASNGKPHDSVSLHYNSPHKDNEYVMALKSVGSVLAPYDSDQLIPVYGFGARIPPAGEISHCFPLTFKEEAPAVLGVQGMLDAYHYAVGQIEFYGPTNFSTFMDRTISMAKGKVSQESQSYNILLVITDGVISDMNKTIDRIVEASRLPLSVVIVGVGKADFANMEVLDADDEPLKNKYGEKMERDIVQFVPLKKYSQTNFSLAKETLAEIPDQFLSFMKKNGIKPNPPRLRAGRPSVNQQPGGPPPPTATPYPTGPNSSPYPGGSAPYPTGPGTSSTPYPTGPGTSSTPYPTGPGTNSTPYPTSGPASAPYPVTGPSTGSAPYPGTTQGNPTPSAPPPPQDSKVAPYP